MDINTLTADYKYSHSNREKLPLLIQKQSSGKLKTFFQFFIAILECTLNLEHCEKK